MIYRNAEIKIEQLVTYFNAKKINLSPAFQRGHVWTVNQRRKLLKNMLQKKPIPAIFLYKEAAGASYIYNILDGKQRLESLILFIGNKRSDLTITTWRDYFFRAHDRKDINFWANFNEERQTFEQLSEDLVRDFGEYVIPAIEITLDDSTALDDIISLFVDINQQGVAVKRFHIVKAMCQNAPILKQTFNMIAIKQKRREDIYYKMQNNDITFVLKRLYTIEKAPESNSRVDRMWEKLLEIAIFSIACVHRKPVDILKGFINSKDVSAGKLDAEHQRILKEVFGLLKKIYSTTALMNSKFAIDATHFYTMVTALIKKSALRKMSKKKLSNKLIKFANILENSKLMKKQSKKTKEDLGKYIELSSKHTTDVSRRASREQLFIDIIEDLV
jgi:transposase-like protein